MTRDEILSKEAGREMNALVATEVMEWHWYKFIEPEYVDFGAKGAWLDSGNRVMHNEWYPSTDNGAAWEVVQALYNKKLEKEYLQGLYAQGIVDLHLIAHHTPDVDCRAALLAVMGVT